MDRMNERTNERMNGMERANERMKIAHISREDEGEERESPIHALFHRKFVSSYFKNCSF